MNRPLELRPETLNRVGVNVALDVLPLAMLDSFVEMPNGSNLIVAVGFVRGDDRVRRNHRLNERHQRNHLDVLYGAGLDLTLTLNRTKHRRLTSGTTPTLASTNTANIGFVQLDNLLPIQRIGRLLHKHTDLLVDSPSAFMGNTQMPFKFFSGNAVLTLANQKNSMKPHGKRRRAFVKNRSLGWVRLEAASASIGAAIGDWMERRLATLRAFQSVGVTLLEDVSQTSLVVGEVLFEVFNGVSHV